MMLKLLVFMQLASFAISLQTGPVVDTPLGKVRGVWKRSYEDKEFSAFYGIPYAQPPIEDLRFEPPKPVLPWNGTLEATNSDIQCPQKTYDMRKPIGLEDCLVLNIYVPSKYPQNELNKFKVIFYIHGGGFMRASGNRYAGPDFIVDKDLILVSINYRLGALGFLSTEDGVLPGNNGMKDQVLAMKFVKNYISYFGGDPEDVTIMGISAGGASVHYHYLSPMSSGLFKNGVSASGTALNSWTFQEDALKKAKLLAGACGCPSNQTKEMIACLRTVSSEEIVSKTLELFRVFMNSPFSPFGLVVERNNSQAFLTDHPYNIIVNGDIQDIPWMVTLVSNEGLFPVAEYAGSSGVLKDLQYNWLKYCPAIFDFQYTLPKSKQNGVCNEINKYYMGDEEFSDDNFSLLERAVTDRLFAVDIEKAAKLQALRTESPVYVYKYNYTSENHHSLNKLLTELPKKYGVPHGDNVVLIFSRKERRPMTVKDKTMQDIIFDIFFNFGKSRKLLVNGIEFIPQNKTQEALTYLQINSPSDIKMRTETTIGNRTFWEKIGLKENENLYSTVSI